MNTDKLVALADTIGRPQIPQPLILLLGLALIAAVPLYLRLLLPRARARAANDSMVL